MHSQLGRVSYEAILSGSGLVRLYHAVVAITRMAPATGATDGVLPPEAIRNFAAIGPGGATAQAATAFCRLLGCHAGGIIPGIGRLINRKIFRRGFEARG